MLKQIYTLFLSPRGRIGRKAFTIGALAWIVFYAAQHFWFKATGTNGFNFYAALVLLILNIQIVFCVFGKRLHDIGRSTWPLIGVFFLMIIIAIFVMLNFGGLEYFNTIYDNPQLQEDPIAMKAVHQTYQESLATHLPQSRMLMSILPLVFTGWLALAPSQTDANRYGEAL